MSKFEGLFEDLDTHTQVMDSAMSTATTLSTPQDQVEALMSRVRLGVCVCGGGRGLLNDVYTFSHHILCVVKCDCVNCYKEGTC